MKAVVWCLLMVQCVQAWTHHAVLDKESRFHLFWTPSEDQITFNIEVETLGYVAIGFSPNGGMRGADVFLAWIDDNNGLVHAHDRYATDNLTPQIDASQDIQVLSGRQNESHTMISFSRKWITCDTDEDMILGSDTVRLIWSYHPEDPISTTVLPYHGRLTRGVRSIYLQEQPNPMRERLSKLPNIKTWDITSKNVTLPDDDHTHYWCQIFKAPDLRGLKHHMLGFVPIIQPGHESYVHHMVLYECHVKEGATTGEWFEKHLGEENGAKCYSPNMPPEWTFCLATNTWAWAVGSEGELLPDHVGIPLGEHSGGADYFMLETHYDNPAMHSDISDHSGLRIFYTEELREFDAAMLLVGTEVNFLHIIPPLQEQFQTVGRCTSDCTTQGIPSDGIRILSGVLHSHLAGRKMRLRHIRNGTELPIILEDNHYDFNFQASRVPAHDVVVLPGDELLLECDYETVSRPTPTFGGLSTREEMCLGFIHYYPRMPLADCRSLPTLDTLMKAFGIEEIYGNSFEKLVLFLKDIEGSEESGTSLKELLKILALETGRSIKIDQFQSQSAKEASNQPLTVEDILKKPFYTVEQAREDMDIEATTDSDYRNLMSDMLLSIRIKSPEMFNNKTIGQHVAELPWHDQGFGLQIQNLLRHGAHNSLCLAHGRRPLTEYKEVQYPSFEELASKSLRSCENVPVASTLGNHFQTSRATTMPIRGLSLVLTITCVLSTLVNLM